MKKIIAISSLVASSFSVADPVIFNLEPGKTTEAQLNELYDTQHMGINKYSNGNMYSIPTFSINFEALEQVTTVFNENGVLSAVLTTFPKSKFDYLNQTIGAKYSRVRQNIPFVGNKSSVYKDGSTKIMLDAPHLSFQMSMNYITQDFLDKFEHQSEYEKRQKEKNEASQL